MHVESYYIVYKVRYTRGISGRKSIIITIKSGISVEGHSEQRTRFRAPKSRFPIIYFSEQRTPVYNGQNSFSQHVLSSEVPLYNTIHLLEAGIHLKYVSWESNLGELLVNRP